MGIVIDRTGLESPQAIDNYYLLLALMGWMCLRLLRTGMAEPLEANSLAFTFLGIIVAFAVSIATIFLGEAVVPAFFLILGWAESYMQGRGHQGIGAAASDPPAQAPAPFAFRRVIR